MDFPRLGGNWIDFVILVFLLLYFLERRHRGFIEGLIDFAGFILSFVIGLKYYSLAARIFLNNFSFPIGIANALGFLFLTFSVELLFLIILSFVVVLLPSKIITSKINKALGIIPSFGSAVIILAFILTAFFVLPIRPDIKQSVVNSKIGGFLADKTLGFESNLSKIFTPAIQETLTFLTVNPKGSETIDLHFKTAGFTVDSDSEQKMFVLVNNERKSRGISALTEDNMLRTVARNHCGDMFSRGYFSHYTPEGLSPFDRMVNAGINYLSAGENIAYAPTVEIAHNGFMNSAGHRANILSPDFGKAGIGVVDAGIYGLMFCQEFTN